MGREIRAAAPLLLIDFAQDRDHTVGHQIHEIGRSRSPHAGVGMIEKHGECGSAGADSVQRTDDCVHQAHNFGLAIRVQQFVM